MGVTLSAAGAKKLQAIAKWYDQRKTERGGQGIPAGAAEDSMWGYTTGCDLSGRRHSFIRVVPDASRDDTDILIEGGLLRYNIVEQDPPHIYTAYETNGGLAVTGKVVRMTFQGYRPDDDGNMEPVYVFQYEQMNPNEVGLPLHDHRDNITGGGFAFACYHPGSDLPMQPWHP